MPSNRMTAVVQQTIIELKLYKTTRCSQFVYYAITINVCEKNATSRTLSDLDGLCKFYRTISIRQTTNDKSLP